MPFLIPNFVGMYPNNGKLLPINSVFIFIFQHSVLPPHIRKFSRYFLLSLFTLFIFVRTYYFYLLQSSNRNPTMKKVLFVCVYVVMMSHTIGALNVQYVQATMQKDLLRSTLSTWED